MSTGTFAAVDLGASSGRVVLGRVGPDTLELREVARFDNGPVRLPDGLHWDVVGLFRSAVSGLQAAIRESGAGLTSLAVDSWAVDYGLLRAGALLGTPFHYRDGRTARGVESVHARIGFEELYDRNGLQFLPFNTLYQLAAEDLLDLADGLLLVPDLIGYWLTGRRVTERTNASTTGLLSAGSRDWDDNLIADLGLDAGLFAPVADPGQPLGPLLPQLAQLLGASVPVSLVGSHDTASAVVGVPMLEDHAAYISCGTWGLVGLELAEPVISGASRMANFTNEAGVDGHTRFLTNVMGTWLLSETLRGWGCAPGELAGLLGAAASLGTGEYVVFDVQDERFVPPGDMPGRIAAWCTEHEQLVPGSRPAVVRSIVESIAEGFADALDRAADLSGRRIDVVHLVGGGSLNTVLCQATADRCGRTVLAGPVEATAIGNLLVQARTAGVVQGSLTRLRSLVARAMPPTRFEPVG